MPRSGHSCKFTPRTDHKMLKEVSKNPKMSSRDSQQALAMVDVKECMKIMWHYLWKNQNWNGTGPCNMTMTQNITLNPPRTGWKEMKWRVMGWPQSKSNLNLIEMLWGDLTSNIWQLKEFCMEKWRELSSDRCQRLVDDYKKCLTEVISAKGGNTSY